MKKLLSILLVLSQNLGVDQATSVDDDIGLFNDAVGLAG